MRQLFQLLHQRTDLFANLRGTLSMRGDFRRGRAGDETQRRFRADFDLRGRAALVAKRQARL